jgi:RNA polymerase sigma-70 factor (TIGR02954 family)
MDRTLLVKAAQKGNAEAFAKLLKEHQSKWYRIAFAHFKTEEDALEAMQETAYRAYKGVKQLKDPTYFSTWVTRILLNYCADELKRRQRAAFHMPEDHPSADEENSAVQTIDIRLAVDQLQPQSKQLIILKYYEDLTITQISHVLDCPDGTVKTRLHKALGELRKLIRKEGE